MPPTSPKACAKTRPKASAKTSPGIRRKWDADCEEAKDTLIYIVAFPNIEAQKKAWDAFWADPEWKKVKADSEKDGVLVKEIKGKNLRATDYSPLK